MLGLYVSDHPLFGLEHVLAAAADCSIAPADWLDEERADGTTVTVGGLVTGAAAQDHQEGRRLGDRHARGPRGRDRGAVLPADLPAGRARRSPRTPSSSSRAGSTGARTQPELRRPGGHAPRPRRGPARPGRDHRCRSPRCTAAGGRAAQGRAGHPPGRHRGAPAAAAAARPTTVHAARRPAAGHRLARRCSATSRRCSGRPASAADLPGG